MDVMNPYFRSRDKAEWLKERNVRIIGNLTGNTGNQDTPAISGEATVAVMRGDPLVVDLAGDAPGLRVLSLFKEFLKPGGYEFWVVVNAFRPGCRTVDDVITFVRMAQSYSGLQATALVANSHLLSETTEEHILHGLSITHGAAKQLGIPIVHTLVCTDFISPKIPNALTFEKTVMRADWLL